MPSRPKKVIRYSIPTYVNYENRPVLQVIRREKRKLMEMVVDKPYLEDPTFTKEFTAATLNSREGIAYNSYMQMKLDTIRLLFDNVHCEKYPDKACDMFCDECVAHIHSVMNIELELKNHRAWWYANATYYEQRYPVFGRFMEQLVAQLSEEGT